jgi:hypothetical protein
MKIYEIYCPDCKEIGKESTWLVLAKSKEEAMIMVNYYVFEEGFVFEVVGEYDVILPKIIHKCY